MTDETDLAAAYEIWNGGCRVAGCEREAVDANNLCRKHRWPYNTPVGELPHPSLGLMLVAVVALVLCGTFGLCVLVADLT